MTPPPISIPRSQAWSMRAGGDPARAYHIQIAWPAADPPPDPPFGGFPVVYLLDGDAVFPMALATLRAQEGRGLSPAILVGIGYPGGEPFAMQRRRTDYTPPGAETFLDFLQAQLIPAIEAAFPTDPTRRAFFGHSLGGLLVVRTLLTRPGLFRHHLAASPSIWWGDAMTLDTARHFTAAPPDTTLSLTIAELEADSPDQPPQRRAVLQARRMRENARDLLEILADRGLTTAFHEFAGESHGSVLPAAVARGLRHALGVPRQIIAHRGGTAAG